MYVGDSAGLWKYMMKEVAKICVLYVSEPGFKLLTLWSIGNLNPK